MVWSQAFFAVRHDQQHGPVAEPAAEKPQQVDGRLVRPVHVLDDDHIQPGRLADLAQQGSEKKLAGRTGAAQPGQLAVQLACEVEQRAEWLGREQSVTRSPRPAGPRQLLLELFR